MEPGVKDAFRAMKNIASRALVSEHNTTFAEFMQHWSAKSTTVTVNKTKMQYWEIFGQIDANYRKGNKVFWRTVECLRSRTSNTARITCPVWESLFVDIREIKVSGCILQQLILTMHSVVHSFSKSMQVFFSSRGGFTLFGRTYRTCNKKAI